MKENKQDSSIFFYRQASKLARIGNWELDVINNKLYWSDIVHELHETNPKTFTPDLETGLSFYREDFRSMVKEIILSSIESGSAFDFEAVIITKKKKERWSSCYRKYRNVSGKMLTGIWQLSGYS